MSNSQITQFQVNNYFAITGYQTVHCPKHPEHVIDLQTVATGSQSGEKR